MGRAPSKSGSVELAVLWRMRSVTFVDGCLRISEATYQAIVLPKTTFIPPGTLKKVIALAEQGGKSLFRMLGHRTSRDGTLWTRGKRT